MQCLRVLNIVLESIDHASHQIEFDYVVRRPARIYATNIVTINHVIKKYGIYSD